MGVRLRAAATSDEPVLRAALRDAANWDPSRPPVPDEDVAHYLDGWPQHGDLGVVAEQDGRPVGAAWLRRFPQDRPGYGFVAPDVPELSVAVADGHRGAGVGARLLDTLLERARAAGVDKVSLSVEAANPARHLYHRLGFRTVGEGGGSLTMAIELVDTAGRAVASLTGRFAAAGVPTPRVDAELLVAHVLGVLRGCLRDGQPLSVSAAGCLERLARRRCAREPLQLLVGSVGFRYLELAVAEGVFIPRPETEVLAGEAVARTPAGGVVVEPCTGSGAVACAVACEASPGTVVATDRSSEAVALARRNALACGVAVDVRHGDLLEPVVPELRGRVDVLVANPPYVAEGELDGLEPEVTDWDPRDALVSGPTGHEVSDRLIAAAGDWLAPGGWLLLEVDPSRAAEAAARCATAGLTNAHTLPDLTARPRIALARHP